MSTERLSSLFAELDSIVADTDYREVLGEFQHVIAGVEAEAFEKESEPGGTPWAPLAESTIRRKGHDRILFETGDLMASFVAVGGPGNISEVSDHGSLFGTSVPYAIFHDQGTSRMPARPPVGINDAAVDRLVDMVTERTIQAIRSL